uniref:Cadherin domain-containing protein n=1 Tax=Glossina brevipalpis TaxID=37001 RepID=A0A1A9WTK8_9MUSC
MKILQNCLLLLQNYLIFIKFIKADNEIVDCTNREMVFSIFNEPIELSIRGVIKIYEDVTIDEITTISNNEFSYNYIDARLEYSKQNDNKTKNLIIFANKYFENYAKEQTATRITLKIGLKCDMGREKILIFFQPLKEGNYFSPIFSQLEYEFVIPTPIFAAFDLTAFQEISATDDDLTNNQISFTSNVSSVLYHIAVGTKNQTTPDKKTYFANLILKRIFMELPQQIQFDIIATDNGIPSRSSKAVIKIRADPLNSLPVQPKFKQTLYKGFIDYNLKMKPLLIELENGTYSKDVRFILIGKDTQGFRLKDQRDGFILIEWNSKSINKNVILQKKLWEMELKGQHERYREFSKTAILIELADFEGNFHFMKNIYEGFINETGNLYIDVITFNPIIYQPEIEFQINMNIYNLTTNLRIFKNNITLELLDTSIVRHITTVSYIKLGLQATWLHLKANTQIIIKLPQLELRPESNTISSSNGNHVEKSIMFKHIEEERHYYGILNLTFNENCTFHVINQWPQGKEFFYLNESSRNLDLIPVDREDRIFDNFIKPYIVIKLRLVCKKTLNFVGLQTQSFNQFLPNFENEHLNNIFDEHEIPYSSSLMWLYLIIDDINDNTPEFQGIENDLLLAYPVADMPSFIYPECIIHLNATDKDIDLNAQIIYKMRDNPFFDIENKTGQIYPLVNGLKEGESTELLIQAIDRNGQGLKKELRLSIKALSESFYILVTLRENVKKSINEITENLNNITDLRIQVIKLLYVPRTVLEKTPKNTNVFIYKAWICAFKDNQPILSKYLKKTLNTTMDYIMNLESFEEIHLSNNTAQNSSIFVNYYLVFILCLFIVYSGCMALLIWYFYCTHSTLKCNTIIPAISSQYLQHNDTINDTIISATDSYPKRDKANDCLSSKSSKSHIKFNDSMKSTIEVLQNVNS